MKLTDLSAETKARVSRVRWDRFIEKHEGPWDWQSWIEHGDAEFINAGGYDVLLPVEPEHHPNITIPRVIPSADGNSVTVFLKDTTWYGDDDFSSGFFAIADRFPGESWYLTIVYHEWYLRSGLGDVAFSDADKTNG